MAGTTQRLWTLLRNRTLSPDALQALQEKKLAEILRHAYRNVPYYAALFKTAGIEPEDISTLHDLKRVPITDKHAMRAAGLSQVLAQGVDRTSCRVERTTGTSGKIFPVYLRPQEVNMRALVRLRASILAGRKPRDMLCNLSAHRAREAGMYQRVGLYRTRYIDHILPLEDQARQLREIQPEILRTWPPSLRAVLHHLDYQLSRVARPRILITAGEGLSPSLARRIRADLPIELFDAYAAAEVGDIAVDCPAHEGLHVHADELIVEIVRDDGSPTVPGEEGTVLVTSLSTYTMPFIRYRLGDRCAVVGRPCSCGLSFPLITAPMGRVEDVVRVPSGAVRSAFPMAYLAKLVQPVDEYRFTQERVDRILLQVVLWKDLVGNELEELRNQLLAYLGEPMELEIQVVDSLPEQTRKFRRFVSLLDNSDVLPT
jgi:phenylacetate-CoA ligase